jgi:hypothetical protein
VDCHPPRQQLNRIGTKKFFLTNLVLQMLLCAGLSANLLSDDKDGALLAVGIGCGGQPGCSATKNNHVVHSPS